MDKDVVHTHIGILFSHKKWHKLICSNMNGPRDSILNEVSLDKKRQMPYDIYHMSILQENWYKWTYLQNRNRVTDVENKRMVIRWENGVRGINWESEVDTDTSLCKK